ncbi:MAG: cold shock domain-containing protein [Aeromicrobium sp.]
MSHTGIVRLWVDDEGWGVVDSPATPGGCWAHFSAVAVAGYRDLQAGDQVEFEYERVDQDGFDFRTVRVWRSGTDPVDIDSESSPAAYSSSLTIDVD